AGTGRAPAPRGPLRRRRRPAGTPAPAARRAGAAPPAALAGPATGRGRGASAATAGRPREGRRAGGPPAVSAGPSVCSASAGQASRNPSSARIAATLPPPSRTGDRGERRGRRSDRRVLGGPARAPDAHAGGSHGLLGKQEVPAPRLVPPRFPHAFS